MWYFMITCYIMSLLTFVLVITAFLQSFLKFSVFQAGHMPFMILTCMSYLFTETLVIFFFVETGSRIKEAVADRALDPLFHKRSIAIKRNVFPSTTFNLLLMMILFILVGAVDTRLFPSWAYQIFFFVCIFHLTKTKILQNQGFKETTEIIRDISAAKQE